MTTPPGSTLGGWRVVYPEPSRYTIRFHVAPDKRDARLAELETALRHIRSLAFDWAALAVEPGAILETIALIAVDALAGAQPEPTATAYEELAI